MPGPGDITHPLFNDPERLESIKRAMFMRVQMLIKRRSTTRRASNGGLEMVLPGGESADDILTEALLKLLRANVPLTPEVNWEALGMRAAFWESVQALRRSGKGRVVGRNDDGSVELVAVVSLNEASDGDGGGDLRSFMDVADAEVGRKAWQVEMDRYESMLRLHRILHHVRTALDPREQQVFLAVAFDEKKYKEIELQPPVTSVRVGQIFHKAREKLAIAIRADPELEDVTERSVQ